MPGKKVIVYVEHYLTPRGMVYFQQEWFPWVYSIISKQQGFISISHHIEETCAHVSLKFEDPTSFEAWLLHPSHDHLVDALDDFRDRDYWKAVRTHDEHVEPSQLQWMEIRPRKKLIRKREKKPIKCQMPGQT